MIKIYTDGSAAKGRSGYGYVILNADGEVILTGSGIKEGATNQQMELMAAIESLESIKDAFLNSNIPEDDVTVYSDSAYLINCYQDRWYINWMNNNWINTAKRPVANKELWELLIPYFTNPRINFSKVAGHSGNAYNEIADKLATGRSSVGEIFDNLKK